MNKEIPNKCKCPTCGEKTYGDKTLEVGDVFEWGGRVIVVVSISNGGYTTVDLSNSGNASVFGADIEYKNLFQLSKDFHFSTPLGKLNDFIKKDLKERIERRR